MAAPPAPSTPRSRSHRVRSGRWHRAARPAALAFLVGACWPLAFGGGSASAFRGWCRADPEVQIAGQTAHVQLDLDVPNMHVAQQLGVGEPIQIVLTVPRGVDARLLAVDRGFGEGYDFQVQPSSNLKPEQGIIPVQVEALIPMQNDGLAVHVAFVPAGSAADRLAASRNGHGPSHPHQPNRPNRQDNLAYGAAAGTANRWVSVLADR